MPYLGDKTAYAAAVVLTDDKKTAFKFTNTGPAFNAEFCALRCQGGIIADGVFTTAIYTDNAGAPNALVANSTLTMGTPPAGTLVWLAAFYSTKPTIAAGATYWLCAQVDGANGGAVGSSAGITNQQAGAITDILPLSDPYGTPTAYSNTTASIFVEATSDTVAAGFNQQIII